MRTLLPNSVFFFFFVSFSFFCLVFVTVKIHTHEKKIRIIWRIYVYLILLLHEYIHAFTFFRCSSNHGKNLLSKQSDCTSMIQWVVVFAWNIGMKDWYFVWLIIELVCNSKRNLRKMWKKRKNLWQVFYVIWHQRKRENEKRTDFIVVFIVILNKQTNKHSRKGDQHKKRIMMSKLMKIS